MYIDKINKIAQKKANLITSLNHDIKRHTLKGNIMTARSLSLELISYYHYVENTPREDIDLIEKIEKLFQVDYKLNNLTILEKKRIEDLKKSIKKI
jgi:hypothetical protein